MGPRLIEILAGGLRGAGAARHLPAAHGRSSHAVLASEAQKAAISRANSLKIDVTSIENPFRTL